MFFCLIMRKKVVKMKDLSRIVCSFKTVLIYFEYTIHSQHLFHHKIVFDLKKRSLLNIQPFLLFFCMDIGLGTDSFFSTIQDVDVQVILTIRLNWKMYHILLVKEHLFWCLKQIVSYTLQSSVHMFLAIYMIYDELMKIKQ